MRKQTNARHPDKAGPPTCTCPEKVWASDGSDMNESTCEVDHDAEPAAPVSPPPIPNGVFKAVREFHEQAERATGAPVSPPQCSGCIQRDEEIMALQQAIDSAIEIIPASMGGHVTLGLNILLKVRRQI